MSTDAASRDETRLEVGTPFSASRVSSRRVAILAAIAPEGSDDVVDRALRASLDSEDARLGYLDVPAEAVVPATPDQPYQLATVRDYVDSVGAKKNIVVMRGDLESVLSATLAPGSVRELNRRNAQMAQQRGYRPLAVATAPLLEDGTTGEFTVYGIVPLRTRTSGDFEQDATNRPGEWVRVNVWTRGLRIQHWVNVACVFILSCTGYYIMDPFFGPTYPGGVEDNFFMGWIRAIHFITAFIWLFVGLTRLVGLFTSKDRYLRWRALWPLNKKEDWKHLWETVKHYAFIGKDGPLFLAHNPLQQLTYTAVYIMGGFQIAIGFMIYATYNMSNPFWAFVATPVSWFGLPFLRLVHTMIMFLLWAFVIIHIYLAVRADSMERHGGVSSMLNGGVWLRRGSRPVDAPEIE